MQFWLWSTLVSMGLAILGWGLYLRERRRWRAAQIAATHWQEVFFEWKQTAEVWQESADTWKETSRIWSEAAENYQRSSDNWRDLYLQQEEKPEEEELIN